MCMKHDDIELDLDTVDAYNSSACFPLPFIPDWITASISQCLLRLGWDEDVTFVNIGRHHLKWQLVHNRLHDCVFVKQDCVCVRMEGHKAVHKKSITYQLQCLTFGDFYIGESGRMLLLIRVKEHHDGKECQPKLSNPGWEAPMRGAVRRRP